MYERAKLSLSIYQAEGATCKLGGDRHGEKGYFVQPTVFADVDDHMTIAKEGEMQPGMLAC